MRDRPTAPKIVFFLSEYSLLLGLLLRLILAWLLPWLLDNGRLIPGVAYTDIDYLVFTDAANYIRLGRSPYDRHTYRYTPFLAEFLAHMPQPVGRYIFCIADAICGWMIVQSRKANRRQQQQPQQLSTPSHSENSWIGLQDALWWLYNPLAINICTRGSSESLMVLLPVLLTIRSVQEARVVTWKNAILSGFWHGVAVHSKLYPIIYTLSFMAYFATRTLDLSKPSNSFPWTEPLKLLRLMRNWISRLLTVMPIFFLATFLLTFFGLTYLAVSIYGEIALQEGLLYHFSRVDHRHNYSLYWYWIYLARAQPNSNMPLMGRLLLLPQIILLVFSSLGVAPYHVGLALFLQTYLFVIHNKVITAQYFTWYLCLLPLCSDCFSLTPRVQRALVGLGLSIGLWLASAYCLEMQGMAVHRLVWMASVLYFAANVNLFAALLHSYASKRNRGIEKTDKVD